jgi:hypothetical protein
MHIVPVLKEMRLPSPVASETPRGGVVVRIGVNGGPTRAVAMDHKMPGTSELPNRSHRGRKPWMRRLRTSRTASKERRLTAQHRRSNASTAKLEVRAVAADAAAGAIVRNTATSQPRAAR